MTGRQRLFLSVCLLFAGFWVAQTSFAQGQAPDIVLYPSQAPVVVGNWVKTADSSAAGGFSLTNPDFGAPKLTTALPNPSDYFEYSFMAEAGRPYHLWIRGKAQGDSPYNDSVHVQFSGSVDVNGAPVYRIGTASATIINLEDGLNLGLSEWGWQDNGWGVAQLGPEIYFQNAGVQTIRVQTREDGLSIDQILLSPSDYRLVSPGSLWNDRVILLPTGAVSVPPSTVASDVVIWAANVSSNSVFGRWIKQFDNTAAGQLSLRQPDRGQAKLLSPLASPVDFFDVNFQAVAGTPYRLWIRGRADNDYWSNDSVFVQFSSSVDLFGAAASRIGTTDGLTVNLEDCAGCGLHGWGWQDTGWGPGQLGRLIYFPTTGTQTLRVQTREDGFAIDQIVLSPSTYLNSSPGALTDDVQILPSTIAAPANNQAPQVTISASPISGTSPLTVSFTSSATDPDGFIASYTWTFGNGGTSSLQNATTIYQLAGSYTASLTVTDNLGYTASTSVVIYVSQPPPPNQLPQVNVSASPTSGSSPLLVNFNANASDPDGYIASYNWNFGDGSTSSSSNPAHNYQSAGSFTAQVTVTDNAGAMTSASIVITVNTPPPSTISQLRVLSWNTAFGQGTDGIKNYDRTASWIAAINPDLIALCEVPPENIPQLLNSLLQRTGRNWYSHFVPKYDGCQEGNLILSKYPLVSVSSKYLSYQRSVAQVTVNIGGRNINFFATHLDDGSSSNRYVEVGELTSWMANFSEPRIIGGDFNGGPDTSEAIRMAGSYYDAWAQAINLGTAVAYPDNPVWIQTRTRRGRIDYVFYSTGSGTLTLKSAQIPDSRDLSNPNVVIALGTPDDKGVRPSDHNQMVADFELR